MCTSKTQREWPCLAAASHCCSLMCTAIRAGKSPLLGSPWPYLMHKRHPVKETPPEHAGPMTVPEGSEEDEVDEVPSWRSHGAGDTYETAATSYPVSPLRALHEGSCSALRRARSPAADPVWGKVIPESVQRQASQAPQMRIKVSAAQAGIALASAPADEPASMGTRRSGRIEDRLSFVSGRGGWHPNAGPEPNGESFHASTIACKPGRSAVWTQNFRNARGGWHRNAGPEPSGESPDASTIACKPASSAVWT